MRTLLSIALIVAVLVGTGWSYHVQADTADYYKVYADSLNVRSEPSGQASVIGSLKEGDVVVVSEEQHGWLKVSKGRLTGWAAGYYLAKAGGKTVSVNSSAVKSSVSSKQLTVQTDSLRMRQGPGTDYKVIGSLSKGAAVTKLEIKSGWFRIRTAEGQSGWISGQYVSQAEKQSQAKGVSSSGGLKGKVIVIDPGHGGDDPGMIGNKLETVEKELNLMTAGILADKLRARGARVILTRMRDDEKPALSERVKISEEAGADAFISVHYNSSKKNTSGTLTFYYSDKDETLARAIEKRLSNGGTGLKSNGISFGDYHVLRENDTPAALVELGFLSNEKDEEIVRTKDYRRKAAEAIADGLEDYFE